VADKISSEDKSAVEKAISELESLVKDENATKEQIETKTQELITASQKIHMAKQQAGAGQEQQSQAKKDDDDVIDVEDVQEDKK